MGEWGIITNRRLRYALENAGLGRRTGDKTARKDQQEGHDGGSNGEDGTRKWGGATIKWLAWKMIR
jgi:hypothetical protein